MKKTNKILLSIIIPFFILVITGLCLMASPFFKVNATREEIHLELGESLNKDPSYYIEGSSWCIPFSRLDTKDVNFKKVGHYTATLHHGFQHLNYDIIIKDTKAPEISCDIKSLTVMKGDTVSLESLGVEVIEYSELKRSDFVKLRSENINLDSYSDPAFYDTYYTGLPLSCQEYCFTYGGKYELSLIMEDEWGNSSDYVLNVTVEEAPELEVADEFYVATNATIEFVDYANCWDFIDCECDSKNIRVDLEQLDLSKTGTYPITFIATDSYGLSTSKEATVHVDSAIHIQDLINRHQINMFDQVIVGALNPYDSGYYENEDIENIQNSMLPAIIHIENRTMDTMGSGYIVNISDEFVTIATNQHVIEFETTPEVYFFEGTMCKGTVVNSDPKRDIAFIRIPITEEFSETSITKDMRNILRTVHINEGYWDSLANDCNIKICYNCLDMFGSSWKQNDGHMVEKICIRDWNDYLGINECIISPEPVAGSSGSAIFDGYGRLVAMVRGYTHYGNYTETVAVPLSDILSYYEECFNTKLQYQ